MGGFNNTLINDTNIFINNVAGTVVRVASTDGSPTRGPLSHALFGQELGADNEQRQELFLFRGLR